MSIFINRKTRRQFLIGTGNTLLALPLLPSLLSKEAFAQSLTAEKRLMAVVFPHNNMDRLWPNRSLAKTPVGSDGALELIINSTFSSATAISPVMANSVYESLRSKGHITILRGLEVYTYYQNHGYQCMGNNSDGSNSFANDKLTPTFDYVIENSSSVYPSTTSSMVTKAIRVGAADGGSAFIKRTGTSLQAQPTFNSGTPSAMFKTVFSSLTGGTTPTVDLTAQLKSNILNRVFNSYTSLKASRKISAEDKLRMDEHLGYISDLQKKFSVNPVTQQLTCTTPATPSDPAGYLQRIPIFLNLQALAFKCGLTKLGTFEFDGESHYNIPGVPAGSYFHGALHGTAPGISTAQSYDMYTTWLKWCYEQVGAQFLAPLNVEEGSTGRTYLDNMLTVLLSEGGCSPDSEGFSHINANYQPVLIGSMAGAVRSNRYYHLPHVGEGSWSRMDIPYNALPITLMKLMGVPASEYQAYTVDGKGFGTYGKDPNGGTIPANLVAKGYVPISEILT